MCDGTEEILFPIDCGARYAFSVSGGELARISVPDTAAWDTAWLDGCGPWKFSVGDVAVCLESASSGWLCRKADVEVADLELPHFYSGDSRSVTAVVTNCHADAYIGCTWSGGAGVTFSDPHSLATTIGWSSADSVDWETNHLCLVTCYEGGFAITNTYLCSVGSQDEPSIELDVSCPPDQFLNDDGRRERFYPVTVRLRAPSGVHGKVTLECVGSPVSFLSVDDRGRMNCEGVPLDLATPGEDPWHASLTVYMFSPAVGTGEVVANFVVDPVSDQEEYGTDGDAVVEDAYADTARFRVFEPLRRLVTNELDPTGTMQVNPSRLVAGHSAVLKVGVNGPFDLEDVDWQVKDGPAVVVRQEGGFATVTPTGTVGVVIVEARFNDDAVQPLFVLPIVAERMVDVKAFVVNSPKGRPAVQRQDIERHILVSNKIFQQVGIRFNLASEIYTK